MIRGENFYEGNSSIRLVMPETLHAGKGKRSDVQRQNALCGTSRTFPSLDGKSTFARILRDNFRRFGGGRRRYRERILSRFRRRHSDLQRGRSSQRTFGRRGTPRNVLLCLHGAATQRLPGRLPVAGKRRARHPHFGRQKTSVRNLLSFPGNGNADRNAVFRDHGGILDEADFNGYFKTNERNREKTREKHHLFPYLFLPYGKLREDLFHRRRLQRSLYQPMLFNARIQKVHGHSAPAIRDQMQNDAREKAAGRNGSVRGCDLGTVRLF